MNDNPVADGPRVRMYRQGFGDCFLISLPRHSAVPLHILIDCGVLWGTKDAADKMQRIARDIVATTRGRLDIVIATHEHWDHLSGFLQAREIFDQMTIGELWLAWTEDPTDSIANDLRRTRQKALRGLRQLAGHMAEINASAAEQLRGPLSFFGATAGETTSDALDYLRHHRSNPVVHYQRPGKTPIDLPGTGVKVYILGPPRNEQLIRRSNPTKSGREVYELAAGELLYAAVDNLSALDDQVSDLGQAFEKRYRVPADKAPGTAFFRQNYFRSTDDWRRIDNDWLGAMEQVALALDSDTNNTSLALALELETQGRVLLFPGDAQVGNWLSWDEHRWKSTEPTPADVTVADLLQRTVLYKVGHHGSHNGTLREKGLEQMTSRDLVVLLPVDRVLAERKRWNIPFPTLLNRLRELARGRVLCADEDLPPRPDDVSAAEWEQFYRRVTPAPDALFYEYALPVAEVSVARTVKTYGRS